MASLKPGDRVPDVQLTGDGGAVALSSVLKNRAAVLYFYPRDETPGCTAEACSFRDSYESFVEAGAEVIGVSQDTSDSHSRFKLKHRLPFTLLSDPDGSAAKAFGVKKTFGLLAGRVTFVIDQDGIVRLRFDSQLRVNEHVREALETIQRLKAA